ncbi:MAG: hypothetical protein MJ252_11420, partial [archaeon]|nr:hypothetical protein [archaeon]
MIRIKNDLIFLLILVSYLFNNILADGENTLIVLPFEKRMDLPFEEEPKKVFMVLKENYLRTEINIGTPSQRLFLRPRIETDYSYIVNEGSYFDSGETIDLIEYKNKTSSN